jgi:GDP-4-dehydro-6-deoxy-D-mannose reductase
MKVLITGANGFVGKYLSRYLVEQNYEVWGTTRRSIKSISTYEGVNFITLELNDEYTTIECLNRIKPDYIIHIAGQSSVRKSWDQKEYTFTANVNKTICLMEAIVKSEVSATVRVLTVGSSEEYGRVAPESMPIQEGTTLNPISPYGISKATVYMLSQHYYHSYGLLVIHARPFNHIGAGQSLGFVTSDFAKQIAEIEYGLKEPLIEVGNLESERDFTDVRDIVVAYEALIRLGEAGKTYNVCSGQPISISYILEQYIKLSSCKQIEVRINQDKIRHVDYPIYVGDPTEIRKQTSWNSHISLHESLQDILNYWREEINTSKEYTSNA